MPAYYNEHAPYAAQWLRNLIAAGHIAPGDVDERSIEDVRPDDLRGYDQCHFFAGIGVWSYALRRAGWPDDRPVWTGSCPCQPFSAAGKGLGFEDERHLWPAWYWLIGERRPPVVFGEQVASSAVAPWIDLVHADVETLDYAFGCEPFPAAGVGTPGIRDRAFWMAYADRQRGRRNARAIPRAKTAFDYTRVSDGSEPDGSWAGRANGRLADANVDGFQGRTVEAVLGARRWQEGNATRCGGASLAFGMAHANGDGRATQTLHTLHHDESHAESRGRAVEGKPNAGPTNGFWRAADWLLCRDGKWRPVEPGTFPLADGAPSRVGRLRAYGNAINAEAATQFILAADEILTT
ncbi:methyltransferase [Burkholderia ubonensis]|uniref:Methyltransferase n=1 Tax=Burkholderia ubonensis TaxID=101571 RepID=A0AA40UUT4_9BURK|nr:DNA cytosine methyltransferase [Burkholderia ubonensis]KWZ53338.1 methyltransferase [Burkholderia ubonensis]